jgi:hypothetical protein
MTCGARGYIIFAGKDNDSPAFAGIFYESDCSQWSGLYEEDLGADGRYVILNSSQYIIYFLKIDSSWRCCRSCLVRWSSGGRSDGRLTLRQRWCGHVLQPMHCAPGRVQLSAQSTEHRIAWRSTSHGVHPVLMPIYHHKDRQWLCVDRALHFRGQLVQRHGILGSSARSSTLSTTASMKASLSSTTKDSASSMKWAWPVHALSTARRLL